MAIIRSIETGDEREVTLYDVHDGHLVEGDIMGDVIGNLICLYVTGLRFRASSKTYNTPCSRIGLLLRSSWFCAIGLAAPHRERKPCF